MKMPIAAFISVWLGLICAILVFPLCLIGYFEEHEIGFIIAAVLVPLLGVIFFGYVLMRERVHRRHIKLWCADAVEKKAIGTIEYYPMPNSGLFHYRENHYRLIVEFSYKGHPKKFYSRDVGKGNFDTFFCNKKIICLHRRILNNYEGDIKILYSPKYNKVLLVRREMPEFEVQ